MNPSGENKCYEFPGCQLLSSSDCVFDASLVPETWQDSFIDSTGVMSQVPGESRYRSYEVEPHFSGYGVLSGLESD
jgi:hypothetical protein